ncbi:MAG: 6-bladed beta-propeller, partial [Paludibacter sp.]|nr:6-bladed beta-propeller [Paludibacter sp.]
MKGAKFLILISAVLFGCSSGANRHGNSDGLTVIDVGSDVGKGRVVDLSEIAQEITYIPLETTNGSYIGRAPVVYFENDRIYVKSHGVIKVFDMSGKYLFTFDRRGRGPEEYIYSAPKIERGTGKFYAESPNSDRSVTVRIYTREGDYEKEF